MELELVAIERPDAVNIIIGQSHFIKTVEDLHEALANICSGGSFGIAFCEASGKRLIRFSGTSDEMIDIALKNATKIGAGHVFVIALKGIFPIQVLKAVQAVPEVCGVYCASANQLKMIIVSDGEQRGIAGVLDGEKPLGIEDEENRKERLDLVRAFGYKASFKG